VRVAVAADRDAGGKVVARERRQGLVRRPRAGFVAVLEHLFDQVSGRGAPVVRGEVPDHRHDGDDEHQADSDRVHAKQPRKRPHAAPAPS